MNKQTWECPECKWRYKSPIRVAEVLCQMRHLPGKGKPNRGQMILIEGSLPNETKRKQETSGKQQVRRS